MTRTELDNRRPRQARSGPPGYRDRRREDYDASKHVAISFPSYQRLLPDETPLQDVCRHAEAALQAAAAYVGQVGERGTSPQQDTSGATVSTLADQTVARLIRAEFRDSEVPIILFSEELGCEKTQASPQILVTIDELDGSENYLTGRGVLPVCTVVTIFDVATSPRFRDACIAYVLDHSSCSLWAAVRGHGLWLDSPVRLGIRSTSVSDIAVVDHYSNRAIISQLAHLYENMTVRDYGSTAFHLAGVASGMFQVAINFFQKAHELAAGYLLIKEAGGWLGTPSGEDLADLGFDFNATYSTIAARDIDAVVRVQNLLPVNLRAAIAAASG
jgi:myo-inositol-1(or 4)-monophosphatase